MVKNAGSWDPGPGLNDYTASSLSQPPRMFFLKSLPVTLPLVFC